MSAPPVQALASLIGTRHPIIQAPMAGTSTPDMAAAVSNAGGLGSIGVGAMTARAVGEAIAAFRTRSSGPLNVNLFCHRAAQPDPIREAAWLDSLRPIFTRFETQAPASLSEIYASFVTDEAMLRTILAARPTVVSFHFGLPRDAWIAALRDAGIVLFATATNVAEALMIEAAGIDAVIAQGYEAGGHRGMFDPLEPDDALGTVALTRLLAKQLKTPVIAAGGVMDGAGIASALRLGASAVQLGTAFVATDESAADAGYRSALFSDAAHHTRMTHLISGRPARCLANRFTALEDELDHAAVPDYPIAYDAGKALHAAAKAHGETGFGAHWAGQGAPLARAMPAAKLMATLVDELDRAS